MKTLQVRTANEWEKWLKTNHLRRREVWLVYLKERAGRVSISYEESVDRALAYGWVDSLVKRIDSMRYARKFTPRRPESVWSQSNLERVERLRSRGRMTRWGLEVYEARTGKKSLVENLAKVELRTPHDLLVALSKTSSASINFKRLSPSRRRRYLMWIAAAKRPETRRRRVEEAVDLISRNVKDLLK